MTDLPTTATTAEAVRFAEAVAPIPVDLTAPLHRLGTAATVWRAWWEDFDQWDGAVSYADRDTALQCAARDYVDYEYGEPDEGEEPPAPVLSWVWHHGRWSLMDGGEQTHVDVFADPILALPAVAAGAEQ